MDGAFECALFIILWSFKNEISYVVKKQGKWNKWILQKLSNVPTSFVQFSPSCELEFEHKSKSHYYYQNYCLLHVLFHHHLIMNSFRVHTLRPHFSHMHMHCSSELDFCVAKTGSLSVSFALALSFIHHVTTTTKPLANLCEFSYGKVTLFSLFIILTSYAAWTLRVYVFLSCRIIQ